MNTAIRSLLALLAGATALAACTNFSIVDSTASGRLRQGAARPRAKRPAPGRPPAPPACTRAETRASTTAILELRGNLVHALPPSHPAERHVDLRRGLVQDSPAHPASRNCDGDPANGCEADLSSNSTCGSCAKACAGETPFCQGGACAGECSAPPMVACGMSCVDITTDPSHCGGCDTPCPADPKGTAICVGGVCGVICGAGYHACGGSCVSNAAIATCGPACSPCPVPANGTATCDGSLCGFMCSAGHADCDGSPANGCEADLSAPASCGSCGAVCSGATPVCNATGAGHSCASSCGGASPTLCGASCVNTTSDPNNCGGCSNVCPAVANGTPTCSGGSCGHVCNGGYHDCGGTCVSNTSLATCGASCLPCPAPANGIATCNGSSCGALCSAGHADCDGNAANGCEADLSRRPRAAAAAGYSAPARPPSARTAVVYIPAPAPVEAPRPRCAGRAASTPRTIRTTAADAATPAPPWPTERRRAAGAAAAMSATPATTTAAASASATAAPAPAARLALPARPLPTRRRPATAAPAGTPATAAFRLAAGHARTPSARAAAPANRASVVRARSPAPEVTSSASRTSSLPRRPATISTTTAMGWSTTATRVVDWAALRTATCVNMALIAAHPARSSAASRATSDRAHPAAPGLPAMARAIAAYRMSERTVRYRSSSQAMQNTSTMMGGVASAHRSLCRAARCSLRSACKATSPGPNPGLPARSAFRLETLGLARTLLLCGT